MIRKLKKKFIFITMLLIALVVVIVFVVVFFSAKSALEQDSIDVLHRVIWEEVSSGIPDEHEGEVQLPYFTVNIQNNIVYIDVTTSIVFDQDTLIEITEEVMGNEDQVGVLQNYPFRYLRQSFPNYTRIAFADRSSEVSMLESLIWISVLVGVSSLIIFFFISLFLANWALRPVRLAWEKQKQFVADASHELKTPLSAIMANISVINAHPEKTIESQNKWIANVEDEAKRMAKLVSSLLFLAKTEHADMHFEMHPVDLSDAVQECLLLFEPIAFEHQKRFTLHMDQKVIALGDIAGIKQIVGILLDNAIKYGDNNSIIELNVEKRDHKAVFSVKNEGEPIPRADLSHLFERFYRVDKARASHGGYGLGLSIANGVALAMDAKITVESNEVGTVFTVLFTAGEEIK